jgi:hypothetical protein
MQLVIHIKNTQKHDFKNKASVRRTEKNNAEKKRSFFPIPHEKHQKIDRAE